MTDIDDEVQNENVINMFFGSDFRYVSKSCISDNKTHNTAYMHEILFDSKIPINSEILLK